MIDIHKTAFGMDLQLFSVRTIDAPSPSGVGAGASGVGAGASGVGAGASGEGAGTSSERAGTTGLGRTGHHKTKQSEV